MDPISEPILRITVTHTATEREPAGTECWVVESHRDPNNIKYFTGYFFSEDFEKAVRMTREIDADRVREVFSHFKAYYSVRHQWL